MEKNMNGKEAVSYIHSVSWMGSRPGLSRTRQLLRLMGNPQNKLRFVHLAGTNGKGSFCAMTASVLQAAGYRTGLFTSPHLTDFRERIRVNGEMIPKQKVVNFVDRYKTEMERLQLSFFEMTTAMAFHHFSERDVEVAIIETGLGGRLDSTNILKPILSIITNIGLDHTALLGSTIGEIAFEKAGIIKHSTPIVIGEHGAESDPVFIEVAKREDAPLYFAEDQDLNLETINFQLKGDCQEKNLRTICTALNILQKQLNISAEHIREGLAHVCNLTHLMGRWQTLSTSPLTICDTGHNIGGWQYLAPRLQKFLDEGKRLHIIFGMVNDKDITHVVALLPKQAHYYFTQASVNRALPAEKLLEIATNFNLKGSTFANVKEAHQAALNNASPEDVIFIGGSTFVVADLLS